MKKLATVSLILTALLLAGCKGNADWKEEKASIMPQLMEGNLKRRLPMIVNKEISRELDIGYVVDYEKGYDFIMQYHLEDWGIDADTLHKKAMSNLEKRSRNTEIQIAEAEESKNGRYAIVETGDGYDAVRLLSPSIQKQMRDYLGDEYVAAVPIRDFLIFWHREFSLTGQFIEQVENEYAAGEKNKLTPRMFLVTKEGLEPLIKRQGN
jgi:uncharacterized protein YtpQ (UPF0354 family)|tara:strand:+ start:415 stop:1041 length:627 start_codon:yes stop_codon:yes gene_type:complete